MYSQQSIPFSMNNANIIRPAMQNMNIAIQIGNPLSTNPNNNAFFPGNSVPNYSSMNANNADLFNLNNKIYSNNNNILLGIIDELNQIKNSLYDNIQIKRIGDIIIKMNFIVNENRKYFESLKNDIINLSNQINQMNQNLKNTNVINNIKNNQEIKYNDGGRYIGQVVNGIPEGKGILYSPDGHRYEGDFRNGKLEGKGILYQPNGSRYEGDFRNGEPEGKCVLYSSEGDRAVGDYCNGKPIGKHAVLLRNYKVSEIDF